MDLSLDEIIKKKGIGVSSIVKKSFVAKKPAARLPPPVKSINRVIDARNKIIQRNRAKIRDAREKLAQITKASGDARLRLQKKRRRLTPPRMSSSNYRSKKMIVGNPKVSLPQLIGVPRGYIDYDKVEADEEYQPVSISLRRTVHNDIIPTYGPYQHSERGMGSLWNNDPFDCYEIPITVPGPGPGPDTSEPLIIHRQIRNMSPDILPPKGILRSNRQASPSYSRRYIPGEQSQLSYEMRSRLEHAPDPHVSVGIFANPLKQQCQPGITSGFRIVVSNLHNSVTQSDIKELFEDIGELHEARLVRPGVAEVIFKALKDAEKAVDTYHNRQLDGQPMKCLLVNPRASNKPTAPAIKSSSNAHSSRTSSNKTPLEIDIDALHKVLFRRH